MTDTGPFYRVWQRTVPLTNGATGQITQQVQSYTELGDGMYYSSNGGWAESQDLVEISPNGAQAVHGPLKAAFDADITAVGAITLTSPAGEVFQSHPLGLFYSDPGSGKVSQIASIQSSPGMLYPPNVVVYSNVLSNLRADLMLVWARNGYEQNLVVKQAPLFAGNITSTPPANSWAYDPVWPQQTVCLDLNAVYQGIFADGVLCSNDALGAGTSSQYVNFCADDYTWVAADGSYFYFAWCDRSRVFGSVPNTRPDADVVFARIKQ